MSVHQLQLRPIDDLRVERFFVPAYQRGYRWTRQQVVELLDDVWDFVRTGVRSKGQFYCLQPIVVAPKPGGEWEVVDGQQRLTTLYLILHHFNERFQEAYRKPLYAIRYETRPASADFLHNLDSARANENIDFFHMAEAQASIKTWMADKTSRVNDIESAFLNDVKVIWYETPDGNPMEVFQRLNIGKIPLTGAELVKALFLRASNFSGEGQRALQLRQLQIAHEWDGIERRLGEDDFWYFLTNADQESNRIDFVLQLAAEQLDQSMPEWSSASVFHSFAQRLDEPGVQAWSEWDRVKRIFLTLEEWFRDPILYHLVGFLASREKPGTAHRAIAKVSRLAVDASSKQDFRNRLRADIFRQVFRQLRDSAPRREGELRAFIDTELGELDYESDAGRIREILLLFNLASLLESHAYLRFPFDAYKREQWDIEHIRSVHSRMPERQDDQKRWLENILRYLAAETSAASGGAESADSSPLTERAQQLLVAQTFDSAAFVELFNEVQSSYHPDQDLDVDNSLGNLTLLDFATNRGYGNAIFPIKRRTIIDLDKVGRFVPLCTRNVFLKYYSPRLDRMLDWTHEDVTAYVAAIGASLTRFFELDALV